MMKTFLHCFIFLLFFGFKGFAQPGTLDLSFNPGGLGPNNAVYGIAVQADGKILVGGDFTSYNGAPYARLMRLNTDGSVDTTFNAGGVGFNGAATVFKVEIQSDGKILVAGSITSYNGVVSNMIVRLNTDGSRDNSFSSSVTNVINDIAIQSDGKIIVVGQFTNIGGAGYVRVARLNTDGTVDPTFNAGSGPNAYVSSVAIQADGKIVIGGSFTSYNGTATNGLARLNTDGSIDMAFDSAIGSGADAVVSDVALLSNGEILVGGDFSSFNSLPAGRMIKLNPNGSVEGTFYGNLGSGFFGSIRAFAVDSDDNILIGGSIETYNGYDIPDRITRLTATGVLDTAFNFGNTGGNGFVNVISLDNVGRILIGGTFNAYNGVTVRRITRLNGACIVNIPDANFKAALVGNSAINTNNDGEIQCSEAQAYTGNINCNSLSITDMTGIEAFTSLTSLYCNNNAITTLDLSSNTALEELYVYSNSALTSIDISNCASLEVYLGQFTGITSLDFSGCPNIREISSFNANGTGALQSIDLTGCTQLEIVNCGFQLLTSVDLSTNSALLEALFNGNPITNFDMSANSNLTTLSCGLTPITSLDVSGNANLDNLQVFNCGQLSALNMANGNNVNFVQLYIYGTPNLSCVKIDDSDTTGYAWSGPAFDLMSGLIFTDTCSSTCEVFSTDVQEACDSYTWIDGNTYTSSTSSATFTLVGGSLNGCDSVITLNLTVISSPSISIVEEGDSLVATAGFGSYTWYLDGNLVTGENSSSFTPNQSGDVYCEVTENGCGAASNTISFVYNPQTSIRNVVENTFKFYPNPSDDMVYVELDKESVVEILDLSGRVLIQSQGLATSHVLNVSGLGTGVYLIRTLAGTAKMIKK